MIQPLDLDALAKQARKVELLSWLAAIACHAPLLWWRSAALGPESARPRLVEISIGSEEPSPREEAVQEQKASSPATKEARPSAPRRNFWAGFQSLGPWGKAPKAQKTTLAAGKESPEIPQAWKPKAVPRIKLAGTDKEEDLSPGPSEKASRAFAASPWASHGAGRASAMKGEDASGDKDSLPELEGGGKSPAWQAKGSEESVHSLRETGEGEGGAGSGEGNSLYEVRGPLARRRVTHSSVPRYPDWALEQGIEADVTVYFVVLPDGTVKEPILVKKTSGDPRLDELVIKALQSWRFKPLPKGKKEEQWGLLTFHFRLRG